MGIKEGAHRQCNTMPQALQLVMYASANGQALQTLSPSVRLILECAALTFNHIIMKNKNAEKVPQFALRLVLEIKKLNNKK